MPLRLCICIIQYQGEKIADRNIRTFRAVALLITAANITKLNNFTCESFSSLIYHTRTHTYTHLFVPIYTSLNTRHTQIPVCNELCIGICVLYTLYYSIYIHTHIHLYLGT